MFMKNILCLAVILFMSAATVFADNNRYDDKRVKFRKEWAEYEKAGQKDLPKTQEKILKRIMDKAASSNACLDLSYAFDEYVGKAGYDFNDKRERLDYVYEVIDGLSPVQMKMLMYLRMLGEDPGRGADSLESFLGKYREDLSGKHYVTEDMAYVMHLGNGGDFHYIDDYEFFLRSYIVVYGADGDEVPERYVDGLVEYCAGAGDEYMINLVSAMIMKADRETAHAYWKTKDRMMIEKCREIADSCGDNAAKILPLSRIAYLLTYIYPETEKECLAADSVLRRTIHWAGGKLADKGLADYERNLIEHEVGYIEASMEKFREKSLSDLTEYPPYPSETEIVLALKNCSDVSVRLERGAETVFDETVHCPGERSFGVADTVSVFTLPELEDGDYYIRYDILDDDTDDGRPDARRYLDISSYAVSTRTGTDGSTEFYLTDARTGEPVRQAGFTMNFDDKEREPFSAVMDFDGFTPLPVEIDCYARLRFVSPDGKRSPEIPVYPGKPHYTTGNRQTDASYGKFFLDRKLFRPGERVQFKYVAYRSDGRSLETEEGKMVSVFLYGADGRKIDSLSGTTNDFGSVSGGFDIPDGGMNGIFSIRAANGGMEYFRVENAEPPTFTAGFNRVDSVFRYDDTVVLTGYVKSYRGYDAEGVKIAYTVEDRWNYDGFSGKTFTGDDGSFSIPVVMTGGYMSVNAVATLPDGESLEFGKVLMTDEYGAGLSLDTDCLTVSGDGNFYSVGADSLSFVATAENRDGAALAGLPCGYSVFRVDANGMKHRVLRGTALTGGTITVDKGQLGQGEYEMFFSLEIKGMKRSVSRRFILLDGGTSAYPDMEVAYVFVPRPSGEYIMGGRDSLWILGEYYDSGTGELLEVCHDVLSPGIHHVKDSVSAFYPGRDLMRSLYVVKDGEARIFRTDIARKTDYTLDMEISSLRKVTSSGETEHFTIVFPDVPDAEVLVDIFDKGTEDIISNYYYFAPQTALRRAYIPYPSAYFGGSGYYRNYGATMNAVMKSAAASPAVRDAAVVEEAADRLAVGNASDDRAGYIPEDILRKDFSSTLAFYPHLRPDGEGRLEVGYETSARLSTFIIQIMAYDKSLRNAIARDEVVVKRELMVSASVPGFLREKDRPVLALTVKNDMDLPTFGRFVVEMYDASRDVSSSGGNASCSTDIPDGGAPVFVWRSSPVLVDAGKTMLQDVRLPEVDGGISQYRLRFAFVGENETKVSDAEEHVVPVVSSDIVAVNSVSAISGKDGGLALDINCFLNEADSSGMQSCGGSDGGPLYRVDVSTPLSAAVEAIPLVLEPAANSLSDWLNALITLKISEKLLDKMPGMGGYIASMEPEDISGYENTPWHDYMSRQNGRMASLDSLLSPFWRGRFADEAVYRIQGFRYSNGAFSWFPGGKPSDYMTLMLLERYAVAEDFGIVHSGEESEYIADALEYLDGEFSSYIKGISDSLGWRKYSSCIFDTDYFVHDYMFVRSFYRNSVALSGTAARYYDKCEKLIAKRASEADVPSKIKYARILLNGDRYAESRRMSDIVASLYEHASADRWGNLCFGSGAVRLYGIFDSEIYVNASALMFFDSLASSGFEGRKGDSGKISALLSGTERHLLSLKEGTDWGDGIRTAVAVAALVSRSSGDFPPKAYHAVTDASGLASMAGDDGILRIQASDGGNLKIVSVSKIWQTRIEELDDAFNGMTVRREFYKRPLASSSLEPLDEGSVLEKGDVIVCKYIIDNDEARSFVRLRAMRPACFTASDIRSGYAYSWRTSFASYRDIRESHTDYYIDYLPDGVSEITEEFFVSVPGFFSAGNIEAVSLYAPQYRGYTAVQEVYAM